MAKFKLSMIVATPSKPLLHTRALAFHQPSCLNLTAFLWRGDGYVHFSDREMKLREVPWGPTACEWQCQRSDPGLSNSTPTPGVGTEIKRCHREDVTSAWQTFDKQLHLNPFRTGLDPGPGVKRMLFSQTEFKRCTGGKQEEAAAAQGEVCQHPNIRLPASVAGLERVLPWRSALKKDS